MLTVAFVTGTEPGKWFTRYNERHTNHPELPALDPVASEDPLAEVLAGRARVGLARLPRGGIDKRMAVAEDEWHLVRLYEEAPGVAVPKDSVFAEVGEEVDPAELEGEIVNYRIPEDADVDVAAVRDALQIVAANVGIAIAPRPLLKVLSKRQVVPLPLADAPGAPTPRTEIAVVWRREEDCEAIQEFVGITRGRSPQSSRGEAKKLSAREKSLAKQARREAAGTGIGTGTGTRAGSGAGGARGAGGKSGRAQNQKLPKRKQAPNRGKRR